MRSNEAGNDNNDNNDNNDEEEADMIEKEKVPFCTHIFIK